MCYYDLLQNSCGHRSWGKRRRQCDYARQHEQVCTRRQVHKHIYDRTGMRICGTLCGAPSRRSSPVNAPNLHGIYPFTRKLVKTEPCHLPNCVSDQGHPAPHETLPPCPVEGCTRFGIHVAHNVGLRESAVLRDRAANQVRAIVSELALIVLQAMSGSPTALLPEHQKNWGESSSSAIPRERHQFLRQKVVTAPASRTEREIFVPVKCHFTEPSSSPYSGSNLQAQQIRLFELHPGLSENGITGTFCSMDLSTHPKYTALSYTWGSETIGGTIRLTDNHAVDVGRNLWEFLCLQASVMTEPSLWWIDAICINQYNVHERNHQVGLMKSIYSNAAEVCVWLGDSADDSDLAMDFLVQQAQVKLRPRGPGYHSVWTYQEGQALHALCERRYWTRMWIIQELLHADKITVWCGTKHIEWSHLEALYLKLKTIEDHNWFAHHRFHMMVLQSSAATMIWQRAHYRHPGTPMPRLRTLIEIFHEWRCADIRDKVFALVSMASAKCSVVPDYDLSTRDVYFAVLDALEDNDPRFANLLSQILGLSSRDIGLRRQNLIEYKSSPPERLVLRARLDDWC